MSRSRSALPLLVAPAIGALLLTGLPAAPPAAAAGETVSVIIELDSPSAEARVGTAEVAEFRAADPTERRAQDAFLATYDAAVAEVAATQDAFAEVASAAGIGLGDPEPVTGLLNAVVTEVAEEDLAALRSTPGVARVTVDRTVRALTAESVPSTGAPEVWDRSTADGTALRGAGVTIAVIDTGIDYSLDDLGGGFGPDFRVVDGWDFANDDDDPMDDHMHGTHVAGVIAGDGSSHITGMAPEATLTAWKALGADGSGELSDVLLALEAAVDLRGEHPASVVNMSLGATGDGTDPLGLAATAASEAGTVVVAAAGNSGPDEQTVGTPAAAEGVIAVGAITSGIREATMTLDGIDAEPLRTWRHPLSANPAEPFTARVVDVGDGFPEDYDAAGDVTGAIVAYRGATPPGLGSIIGFDLAQAQLAEERGASGALVYTPQPTDPVDGDGSEGPISPFDADPTAQSPDALAAFDLRRETMVMTSTTSADYQRWRDAVLAGDVTATIGSVDASDRLAVFSSRGPADGMTLKPEIVAPGVEILSTIPASLGVEGDAYRLSGTSMAAPHVAGAAALLREALPDEHGSSIRSRLIGGTRDLAGGLSEMSPALQGSGALDVPSALDQPVTASPDTVSFGLAPLDDVTTQSEQVVFENASEEDVTLALALAPSDRSTGTATLDAETLVVPAGGTAGATVTATRAEGATAGETSGRIIATLPNGSAVHVPYAAFSRPLTVLATPSPASTDARVFSYATVPVDADPVLELTAPSGAVSRLTLEHDAERASWYHAPVALSEKGTYTLDVSGSIDGVPVTGRTTLLALGETTAGAWESVGPVSQGALTAVSPGAPGTAMAVTNESVNPFITTDHGATWTRVPSMPVSAGVVFPAADDRAPGAFWAAVNGSSGQAVLDGTYQGRILHTPDAGATWTVLPFPDVTISAFAASGDMLAVASADGVRLSSDAGASWTLVENAWPEPVLTVAFSQGDLLVNDYHTIWRLADVASGGRDLEIVLHQEDRGATLAVLGADDERVAAIDMDGLMRESTDGGATWSAPWATGVLYPQAVHLLGATTYLQAGPQILASDDGGRTLTPIAVPIPGVGTTDIDAWPGASSDELLVTLENTGVFETTTGGDDWSRIGVAGATAWNIDLGVDADGAETIRVADPFALLEHPVSALDPAKPDWGLHGAEGAFGAGVLEVQQSEIGERTVWSLVSSGGQQTSIVRAVPGAEETRVGPRGFGGNAIGLSPTDEDVAAVGFKTQEASGVMVSNDGFATWETYPLGVAPQAVVFDPVVPDRLWIAGDTGVYRSDDLGRTATRVTDEWGFSVWVDPEDADHILFGTDAGVLVSDDAGESVRVAALPASNVRVRDIVAAPLAAADGARAAAGRVLVAGTALWYPSGIPVNGAGAFISTDDGETWTAASNGLTALSITSLDVTADGDWVVAGTIHGGVWRTAVDALVPGAVPEEPEEPGQPGQPGPGEPVDPDQPGTPGSGAGEPGDDSDDDLAATGASGVLAALIAALVLLGAGITAHRLHRRRSARREA
jgi:subtilisin family serine protease